MKRTLHQEALSFQQIKFESELDRQFGRKISAAAYGENLFGCIQCGTCSGTCPMSSYMDFTPRKIIAMVRAGFKEEVLTNKTVWLCASCYSCTVECPKGIRITDVMYALKREAITTGMSPRGFAIPILANTFFKQVRRHGRLNEVLLMTNYYLSTNPFKAFSQIARAFKLLRFGRLRLFERGVRDRKSLERILSAAEAKMEATI
jgi:quinone-modifying oxidoreductase, subunit QmoC